MTGYSRSTWYAKVKEGKAPKPSKIDPTGRVVIWWLDDIEAMQRQAVRQ
jgi:predicted DNA-binding transcriptional regulator AlpA